MTKEIDRIVEAFIPEMTRIWDSDQSHEQEERKREPAAGSARPRAGNPLR
jgi:hypothetical protein